MKKSTSLLLIVFLFSCSQVKTVKSFSCNNFFELQIDKKKGEIKADKNQKYFTVNFLYGFDEEVESFVNNKLVFSKCVMTKNSSDEIEFSFGYNYSHDNKNPILKLSFDRTMSKIIISFSRP